jgi:hypothetical protein
MELTFKDTLMFYQTSLRNVGLYTSISLALLGVSRFYRGQGDSVYNIAFILVSLATLLLAFSILQNLNSQISMFRGSLKDENQKKIVADWLRISTSLQLILIAMIMFTIYTFYKQF